MTEFDKCFVKTLKNSHSICKKLKKDIIKNNNINKLLETSNLENRVK